MMRAYNAPKILRLTNGVILFLQFVLSILNLRSKNGLNIVCKYDFLSKQFVSDFAPFLLVILENLVGLVVNFLHELGHFRVEELGRLFRIWSGKVVSAASRRIVETEVTEHF